jgi:hypothetical protein
VGLTGVLWGFGVEGSGWGAGRKIKCVASSMILHTQKLQEAYIISPTIKSDHIELFISTYFSNIVFIFSFVILTFVSEVVV